MLNKPLLMITNVRSNTYISSRISSLDSERNWGKPLVKTFLKQLFFSSWLLYPVLLRTSKINNIQIVEKEWI